MTFRPFCYFLSRYYSYALVAVASVSEQFTAGKEEKIFSRDEKLQVVGEGGEDTDHAEYVEDGFLEDIDDNGALHIIPGEGT